MSRVYYLHALHSIRPPSLTQPASRAGALRATRGFVALLLEILPELQLKP